MGTFYARHIKRLLDATVASVLLVLFVPIVAAVALLIHLRLGRPVLFRQQRPGREGRLFVLLKFRTMTNAAPFDESSETDDQRLTPFGRFLRSSSLDELPELLNVVRGEMSLVGPRPLLPQYLDRYTTFQARRHEVRPGITGLAQVKGRNQLTWEEKFAFDVYYVDHVSFWLDVRIIVLTIQALVTRRGISAEGHATAREFMGSES